MAKKPDIEVTTCAPVDPSAFSDLLREVGRRIEERSAARPQHEPEPPADPWAGLKPGTLIAAEEDVRRWELLERLELGLCGGPEACRQARCRRARRCAALESLRPEIDKARATLARERAAWEPPTTLPERPQRRRKPQG